MGKTEIAVKENQFHGEMEKFDVSITDTREDLEKLNAIAMDLSGKYGSMTDSKYIMAIQWINAPFKGNPTEIVEFKKVAVEDFRWEILY